MKIDHLEDERALKLDVYSDSSGTFFNLANINAKDFLKPLTWQIFTLNFTITERTEDVEFRGWNIAVDQTVWLDYVEIIPN